MLIREHQEVIVRTIVAGTDFSDGGTIAVERAGFIAKSLGGDLELVHVFNASVWKRSVALLSAKPALEWDPLESLREHLEETGARVRRLQGINVNCSVLIGRASEQIRTFAKARAAEMVVVGAHGEHWLRDVVVGGSALKVIERAHCPVLVARIPSIEPYSDVLVGIDVSESSKRAAQAALSLFSEATIHLLAAYYVPFEGILRLAATPKPSIELHREEARKQAQDLLDKVAGELGQNASSKRARHIVHGYPSAELCRWARTFSATLIALGKHGGTVPDEPRIGSTARNVLYLTKSDVLMVP